MGKILAFLFCAIISLQPYPQQNTLTHNRASQFIEAMINASDSLESFVFPEELVISKRLGINYEGVKNKFLISYEIPGEIINEIKNRKADYIINIEILEDQYSILHFEVPLKKFKTEYYFKGDYLISPPSYHYKDWQRIESEYFIFYVSNTEYFNQYSIDLLEKFVAEIHSAMNFSEEEIQLLEEHKIIYILCEDEDKIEKLTGYKARGMCNLAYDYLITTYNCHYHELVHLLANFKLRNLPLYTHPFFQEGLAVAIGGRGGKEPDVILNLGTFLAKSGFMTYNELLNANEFKSFDASMSYPISGLYNRFLLHQSGIEDYLKLYLKYNAMKIEGFKINPNDLPDESEWQKFVNGLSYNSINIEFDENNFSILTENVDYFIKENDEYYLVGTKGSLLISIPDKEENYKSKIFQELYPDKEYNCEKYLIRINDNEIAIYNFLTNNLMANYVSGFTTDMKRVQKENGFYEFSIRKDIFDEGWDSWVIISLEIK